MPNIFDLLTMNRLTPTKTIITLYMFYCGRKIIEKRENKYDKQTVFTFAKACTLAAQL